VTSTLKFNNWQDAAGNAIYDASNGGVPVSGNAIINGDFGVWQRGTSFTGASDNVYFVDRWKTDTGGGTVDYTRESFTPTDLQAVGYGEGKYFCRIDQQSAVAFWGLYQRIEDVRTLTYGGAVTLSFWAKATSSTDVRFLWTQSFGSGGSGTNNQNEGTIATIGTTWQRFTYTFTPDSISGKTIGDGSFAQVALQVVDSGTNTLDVWGVQLEAGPVATPFKLAGGGSKAAELALCHRYFQLLTFQGTRYISTAAYCYTDLFTEMRAVPSLVQPSSLTNIVNTLGIGAQTATGFASQDMTQQKAGALFTGVPSGTIGVPVATTESIKVDAEL